MSEIYYISIPDRKCAETGSPHRAVSPSLAIPHICDSGRNEDACPVQRVSRSIPDAGKGV